jgi:hypothetical protein
MLYIYTHTHMCVCVCVVCVCVCVCVYLCSMYKLPKQFRVRPALEDRRVRMDGKVWHRELEALPIKVGHHLMHFLVRGGAMPDAKKKR